MGGGFFIGGIFFPFCLFFGSMFSPHRNFFFWAKKLLLFINVGPNSKGGGGGGEYFLLSLKITRKSVFFFPRVKFGKKN